MGRELNKGEAAHDLSRFLCFGKEGVLRGREFGDQVHTFSCLSVLHNAVVAWNILHIEPIANQLRAEGKNCDDHILSLTTPLMRKHLNPLADITLISTECTFLTSKHLILPPYLCHECECEAY
jgi:hypothetical protein